MLKNIFFIILIFMLSGCVVKIPDPDSYEAKVYKKQCSQCHQLPHPRKYNRKQWVHLFRFMQVHHKRKDFKLTEEQRKAIGSYLDKYGR